ncbi:MAG: LamG domain-containing protein, partial [Nanoarchaeota archaeon]|nr:LamG domain-containing protein [Nanoarchaeota archaeon]
VRYIAARTTANTHTFNGSIDQLMFWNRTLSSAEIAMMYNNGAGMYNRTHSDATSKGDTWYAVVTPVDTYEEGEPYSSNNVTIETSVATITLTSPLDGWYVNSTAKFECLATSSIPITSVSLYHNNTGTWLANSTITSSATSVIAHFTVTGLATNNFDWSCRACDATDCYYASTNRTLHVDVTNPDIEFVAPTQTNNTKVATFDNFNYVNVSVSDISNNYSAFIDWNRSLVGWWRLEDEGGTSFSDSSTWNNQGSCSGIACPNLTTGMRGKAYKFDGVDDVVTIPAFNLGDIPSITFSAWIKLHNASISSLQGIIYKSSTVMDFYITNTGKLNVYLTNDVAWHSTALTSTYTDWNDWHHVVAIYNGSAVIIYRDGQQVAIDNIGESGDIPASNGIAIIGKNSGGAFTNGSIDEVMIWNRALSPEEINASYNANIWKLYHNFTSLSPGTYTYKAYVVDQAGNLNNTEQRTFIVNSEPTVTSAILNSTYGTNLTTENLTAYVTYNDNDSDAVTLVYDWRKDGISDAVLNMPFDVNGSNENYLNVKDYSTFGKNGTLINATWNTSCGAFADSGGCYEFRSNGWIVTPIIANYSQWTLSTWINPAVPISDAAPIYGIYAIFSGSNTTNFLGISNSALRMYTTTIASYDFTNNPGWHNVVYSFNGTLLTGYVDVTNTDSITLLQNPLRGDIVRYIAARTTANTHTFNGSIDQLMFWNRTLSSAEIAMLYNNGAGMYNRTHSDATSKGDTWYAVVTPVDAYEEGESVASNNVTIETSVATVTLTSPQDRWYVNSTAKFECLATSSIPITSVSLYHNNTGTWQANSTITSSATSVIAHFTVTGLTVNNFEWSCRACDATDCYFASINRTLYVDITNPDIAFVNPTQTNNTKVATFNNFNYVNVSVTDASNNYSAFIDWNRSLVGWWRLEDEGGSSFSDSSTWGNNGTCSGTACPNLTTGMRGKAYKFDGIDDYVAINSSPLNINADNSYSISLWTKIKGSTGTTMSLWEGDTLSAPSLESNGGTTNFFYYIYNGAGYSYIQTGTLTADIWYHIVAVYDESAYKQELFVNGVSKGSNSLNVNDSINSLYIGARGGRTLRFNGSIDEVQVWNRALSSEEINASYSAGIYKLYRNFTSLNPGTYTYKAYVVDQAGNLNTTEQRTFIVNSEPTVTSAILNSTYGTNLTTENLTVYAQYNDNDSDTVSLVYDWRKDGISDAVLNMPFDVDGSNENSTNVKDYTTYSNNGSVYSSGQLILNSGVESGSLNWASISGISSDSHTGSYSLYMAATNSFTSKELMPIDTSKIYTLNVWAKFNTTDKESRVYIGYVPYDINQIQISSQSINAIPNSATTLYEEVLASDTKVKVVDGSGWTVSINNWMAFNTDNSGAYTDLPNYNLSTNNILSVTDNDTYYTITFNTAIGKNAAAGTSVRMHTSTSTYMYDAAANAIVNSSWTNFTGSTTGENLYGVSSGKWWHGTKYAKILVLANRPSLNAANITLFDDFTLYSTPSTYTGAEWNSSCNAFSGSGGCYEFDGQDDYIVTGLSGNDFDTNHNVSYTIESWVNLRNCSIETDDFSAPLFGRSGTGSWSSWLFGGFTCTKDDLYFYGGYNPGQSYVSSSYPHNYNEWYHLVGVFDNTTTNITFYVNGVARDTDEFNGVSYASFVDNYYSIASSVYSTNTGFNGNVEASIDNVKVYDRALSASEIAMLYNDGAGMYNRTHSDATSKGDIWQVVVTPVDAYEEGEPYSSNNVIIETTTATVTLTDPQDGWYVNSTAKFECLATSAIPITSVSLYHNNTETWLSNSTITTSATLVIAHFTVTGLTTNNFDWSCRACDATDCYFALTNRTLHVDVTNPDIEFVNPTADNNTKVATFNNYNYVNVSVSDVSNNYSAFIDWNRSLVGWWRLEDEGGTSFSDSSTWNNQGSCSGIACPNLTTGMKGKAYKFDGVDDRIDNVLSPSYNYTITLWIKTAE